MNPLIKHFIENEKLSTLAVALPDGGVTAATMHFAYDPEKNAVLFGTHTSSRKYAALINGAAQAAVVIGSGENWKTLQMRGTLQAAPDPEPVKRLIYGKNPEDRQFESGDSVWVIFTPSSWRYTDYTKQPPQIIEG